MQSLLIFGTHPDDIEFGCNAIIAAETRSGRKAHCVVAMALWPNDPLVFESLAQAGKGARRF